MSENNYMNLYLDAHISDPGDQAKYGRCLDAVLAQEGITVDDIIGVGEHGTSSNLDLYVVHRHGITLTYERGLFSKKIGVEPKCPLASIARLRTTEEGFKGRDLTITGHDAAGGVVLSVTWGLSGPDWAQNVVLRQREHLFKLISAAMDQLADTPARLSVSTASSKAGALMDWAADVVKAAGVEVTNARVEEHANMVAGGINFMVFLRLGGQYGIDDLNQFYPNGEMPSGTPIATFDDLYGHVVTRVGDAQAVDRAIDEQLAGAWIEFVNGCRAQYS